MHIKKEFILRFIISFFALLAIYLLLYKIYIPRIMEFGCFDDCHTIAAGYFISQGKMLYSEIFYNHQMLFPYLSFLIQSITHPENLFELILRHRQVILLLSFVFNLVFITRFGKIGFLFIGIFEFSKFYFFGDRFLPEALVVYPIVYMVFLILNKFNGSPLLRIDYLIASIYTFLVLFSREPYIPLAILLFMLIMINKKDIREKAFSIILLFTLSLCALATVELNEFFYTFFTFNPSAVIQAEVAAEGVKGIGVLKVFFYYIHLLFLGENNFLRHYLFSLSLILITSAAIFLKNKRNIKLVLITVLILGLSSIRYVIPGHLYFQSYRLNIWYGVILITILFYLINLRKINLKIFSFLVLIFISSFIYLSFNKDSFLKTKPDPHYSLLTNYGRINQIGNVLKTLSDKNDTVFPDSYEELIYPVSDLSSNYKYSMYTSQMPFFEKYRDARWEMFVKNPPDFYYDYCLRNKTPANKLDDKFKNLYTQLMEDGKPSCIFVKKTKLDKIPKERLEKINEDRFSL